MKKSVIYLPKHVGGLGVIDITVQQHILQQRYVRALLLDNQVSRPIPVFLMQLLSTFIQVTYGASHPQLPLLFATFVLEPPCLINTVCCLSSARWMPLLLTRLGLLVVCRCLPTSSLSKVVSLRLWCSKHEPPAPALAFYPEWLRPSAPTSSNFVSSLCTILVANPAGPEPLLVTGGGVDLSPYYCHKLSYQSVPILSMSSTELRAMYMRDHPPLTNPRVDVNRLTVASFLQTKMPSAARNLWFRLIHNKVSSKVNVYKIFKLPDNLCVYCGYRETTTHILFTCPANRDIWTNYFSLLFVPLGPLDMSQVAMDVLSLDLSTYCLLESSLKVSTFEAITCVITAIWRTRWRDHYDSVGFDNQSVMDRAMINLRRLSSLNLLS
ncbi:hypothetical protein V8B55DRAFT_1600178 [Mucor lusitanicus]